MKYSNAHNLTHSKYDYDPNWSHFKKKVHWLCKIINCGRTSDFWILPPAFIYPYPIANETIFRHRIRTHHICWQSSIFSWQIMNRIDANSQLITCLNTRVSWLNSMTACIFMMYFWNKEEKEFYRNLETESMQRLCAAIMHSNFSACE